MQTTDPTPIQMARALYRTTSELNTRAAQLITELIDTRGYFHDIDSLIATHTAQTTQLNKLIYLIKTLEAPDAID
jgi:phage anti-repressor protein